MCNIHQPYAQNKQSLINKKLIDVADKLITGNTEIIELSQIIVIYISFVKPDTT